MRVLFLTHRLPYAPNRGDRIRAYHILKTLAAAHVEAHVLSLVHTPEEAGHADDLGDIAASVTIAPVTKWRNRARAIATLATRRPITHALLDAPFMRSALERCMAERQPDVVLAYGSGMARFALTRPLTALPYVLDMVDVDSQKWAALAETASLPIAWVYGREARQLADFEREATRRAHATLVVNERERLTLLGVAPESDVRIVPVGVDLEMFRQRSPVPPEPQVVFCGVMNYVPNADGAVWLAREVWPRVHARRPDARLQIVGSEPTAAVRRLGRANSSVTVTGTVGDVRPFLWRSSVAVAPLAVARGVQTKVLEAAAAGLPSVVTPQVLDGLPAEIAPACMVAQSAESFAQAILDLLGRSVDERRTLIAGTRLDRLAWSEQLRPIVGILDEAIRGRRAGPRSGPHAPQPRQATSPERIISGNTGH